MSVLLPGEVLWPQKDQVFGLSQVSVLFVSFLVFLFFSFVFHFYQCSFALLGSAGGEFMKAFDSMRNVLHVLKETVSDERLYGAS